MTFLPGSFSFKFGGRVYRGRLARAVREGQNDAIVFGIQSDGESGYAVFRSRETCGTDEAWWSPRRDRLSPLERAVVAAAGERL